MVWWSMSHSVLHLHGPHNHCPFVIWGQPGHRPLFSDISGSALGNTLHMLIFQPICQQGVFLVAHARVQNDSHVSTFDPLVHSVANGNLVRSHFFFCPAQVSGSNNTTFISSGQVMNFSGEVIVVYVGHSSPGSDGTDQEGVFRNPVQEEANESTLHFRNISRAQEDSISHDALQDETLPVQEMMERWMLTGLLVACPLN